MKKLICGFIISFCCFSCFSNVILKGTISGLTPVFQNHYYSIDEQKTSKLEFNFDPFAGLELSALWETKSEDSTSFKMIYGIDIGFEVTAIYIDAVIGFNKILTELNNCNLELSVVGLIGPAMNGLTFFNTGVEANLYFVPKIRKGFFGGVGISDKDLLKLPFYENNFFNIFNFNMIKVNLSCGIML